MILSANRYGRFDRCTISHLYIDGADSGYVTMEPKERQQDGPVESWKVPGETAIPRGKYRIEIRHSPRFKRDLPFLCKVDGFEGVAIHPFNFPEETEACIGPGEYFDEKKMMICGSRRAYDAIFARIKKALAAGEQVWIEVF